MVTDRELLDEMAAHNVDLRKIYVDSPPQRRLGTICGRLRWSAQEVGATQVVTMVSAVEGLARSLVVHWPRTPAMTLDEAYKRWWKAIPEELVREVLRLASKPPEEQFFGADRWALFTYAVKYRNLIAHECTFLGQDKTPALIGAAEWVFDGLIELGGLTRPTK